METAQAQFRMTPQQMSEASRRAQEVNRRIHPNSSEAPNEMGRESFLRLLVTELRHQDPTRPMEDREFIAQMAQFSSLEQMRNINEEIRNLARGSHSAEAYSLLGRSIEAFNAESGNRISGVVSSVRVSNNEFSLMVGNAEVSLSDIQQVHESAPQRPAQADDAQVQNIEQE